MALGKNKKGVFLPEKVLGASLPLRVLMVITKQFLGDSHPLASCFYSCPLHHYVLQRKAEVTLLNYELHHVTLSL